MNPIGLYDYEILNKDAKALLLWRNGTFIMSRLESDFSINLYSLFDFFVEAWYHGDINSIEKIRTFKSLEALEPYLDRIKLDLKP